MRALMSRLYLDRHDMHRCEDGESAPRAVRRTCAGYRLQVEAEEAHCVYAYTQG